MPSNVRSNKDRKHLTKSKKKVKEYLANLQRKYPPLVPQYVDFVKAKVPNKESEPCVDQPIQVQSPNAKVSFLKMMLPDSSTLTTHFQCS